MNFSDKIYFWFQWKRQSQDLNNNLIKRFYLLCFNFSAHKIFVGILEEKA
jgi:hypothetical protein